ncbi:DUF4307 domain-containing protein [Microbacterium luticocti]|uniref:DUF4307 domain-containing protein n=1 Tax=Microbacterium luticocti TaxID=451764 RepID=UPI0004266EBB|nr:DUF4307 domain-containing protein [Microbacterium luticocti]
MTTQQMLDERYGRTSSPRRRRTLLVVAIVAIGAALAVMVWAAFGGGRNTVDATATGFTVVDAHRVDLAFQITAPAGTAVTCVLEADDTEHGVVGWKIVRLPASSGHTHAYSESIPTVGEATTGLVNTCWVP